jgi:hypothetical protein
VTQPCPDGCSGKLGVASPGVVGVAGSNSGRQSASASVLRLPSVSASRIASTGRQNLRLYLSFQQTIAASAAASVTIPNMRAFCAVLSP